MKSILRPKVVAFVSLLGICAVGFSAESVSPQMANSAKAQRDRDLTLIGNSSAAAGRATFVKTLKKLQEHMREQLADIDARLRDPALSDAAKAQWTALRDRAARSEKLVGERIAKAEADSGKL